MWLVVVIAVASGVRGVWAEAIAPAGVFDVEMTEGGEEWTWMEKGLADMFTTHFVRAGVPVVARDEMQAMARKMNWVPEMGEKKEEMDEIKKRLRISYLVTGV